MKIPADVNFADYIKLVGELEAQEIYSAGHWTDAVVRRATQGVKLTGDTLPWSKTHGNVRLRPGELSIWAGMNGHKKSMLLGFVMVNLMGRCNVSIASLEMKPEETLFRMCRQGVGCMPSESAAREFMSWADQSVLVYDQLDKVAQEKILGYVHYCAKELGCRHVVIDSLTKCGLAQGDHDAEKDFIDRLQWAAKTLNCHIHLVCHVRKPSAQGEEYIPNKFDVRGAGELTDLVDNVFIVWKDKAKEQAKKIKDSGQQMSDSLIKKLDAPDQLLIVAKQRHGEWEGAIQLWFHEESLQFLGDNRGLRIPFDYAPAKAA
jgi:twinkle protein